MCLRNQNAPGFNICTLKSNSRNEMELERLMREKMLQQEVYKVLAKEHELVKIESAKDQDMIEVIDQAHLPERKSKPRRSVICILFTMIAFLSCFIVLCKDSFLKSQSFLIHFILQVSLQINHY